MVRGNSMKSYLLFQHVGNTKSGKTKIVTVFNGTLSIGFIRWFSKWRRYCFFPKDELVFDSNCLTEITEQLKAMNEDHKANS